LIERGGDTLIFSFFTAPEHTTLFAQAVIDITKGQTMQYWLEQVADSSRYYVLKIQSSAGREAMIGFGFRDRDQATDLRECLQHYEKAIRREKQANTAKLAGPSFSVPVMSEGEKIHVDRNSGRARITKKAAAPVDGHSPVPLLKKPPPSPALLKKPPPPPPALEEEQPPPAQVAAKSDVKKMTVAMGEVGLDAAEGVGQEGADGAV
jgi:hypothetical protein